MYEIFLDSNADKVKLRSTPEPEGVLQLTELLATHDVDIKLVSPILDLKDISNTGYPRVFKNTIWDALAGVMTRETSNMAGVKYVM
jgi:hypothetical protein